MIINYLVNCLRKQRRYHYIQNDWNPPQLTQLFSFTIEKQRSNQDDQLELSGSEQQPLNLVLVHSYRRPAYERYASRLSFSNGLEAQAMQSPEVIGQLLQQAGSSPGRSAHIPKLLLPKANRPKMYSLNGFIPKPNVQKLATNLGSGLIGSPLLTTASPLNSIVRRSGLRKHSATRLNGLHVDQDDDKRFKKPVSSRERKRQDFYTWKHCAICLAKQITKKFTFSDAVSPHFGLDFSQISHDKDMHDADDLSASGSATRRRQIMFTKRKGMVNDNRVEEKATNKSGKKVRKLKAIDFQFPKANYPKELLESLRMLPEAPKLEEPLAFRKLSSNPMKSSKQEYPSYAEIPKTRFTCPEHVSSGVFADIDTQCQAWHMCQAGRKHR